MNGVDVLTKLIVHAQLSKGEYHQTLWVLTILNVK